ncbi:MAG: preprotein translocase subunit SecY [Bacteroidia bacterium]|nr:preprotein translocase subunit SecY [Bacteroidia bacterium]
MKRIIETIQNIWKIEELRNRIMVTLLFVAVYRLGSYVVLPGVNSIALNEYRAANAQSGIIGLINIFAGGAFSRASIFGLGIMPYITASIIIQLLGMAIPYFQKLQREGESGRKKLNQYTRLLTIAVTAVQAPGYLASQVYTVPGAVTNPSTLWWFQSIVVLVTGTMFVMWLGERITDRGIGNGISLIIMVGIISRLPFAIIAEFVSRLESQGGGLIIFLLEIVFLLLVIMGSIMLVQGTRRIPVQFAKKIIGNKQYGGVRQYIPLKVNTAGVMPIIFAQAIMFIPAAIAGYTQGTGGIFTERYGFWYNFIFGLLIILFTYFYTAIMVNPTQLADDLKRNGGFIPGIKPGKKTAEFIDQVMSRITLPGAIFLAIVAILPSIAIQFGVNSAFADFYGGTSLLILVGVILDTLQQIETYLLNRHYEGLMKSGRIKGRGTAMMQQA